MDSSHAAVKAWCSKKARLGAAWEYAIVLVLLLRLFKQRQSIQLERVMASMAHEPPA